MYPAVSESAIRVARARLLPCLVERWVVFRVVILLREGARWHGHGPEIATRAPRHRPPVGVACAV